MGLVLLEIIASARAPLHELVAALQARVGPAYYMRRDPPEAPNRQADMARRLAEDAPGTLGGQRVAGLSTVDGVRYLLADDSWLLTRPSGTKPLLRVYADRRSHEMAAALLDYGQRVAAG